VYKCRKEGSIVVLGVFAGPVDKFPLGALMNTGITMRSPQMHGQRPMLLERMERGKLTTEHLATHVLPLDEGAAGYRMLKQKTYGCVRSVFLPG
jgi:threonine dehydrogenase-like Zn-dependent dehydrogenase